MEVGTCLPTVFSSLTALGCIGEGDIAKTLDGFHVVDKSVSDILVGKGITELPGLDGGQLPCERFFDDWYLYAVPSGQDYVYSLLKLREQEYDAVDGGAADGDDPGVTISFIAFAPERLIRCVQDPTEDARRSLSREIHRVVAQRGQRHHEALKRYFLDPGAEGAYLCASLYVRHIASFVKDGYIETPEHYQHIARKWASRKASSKLSRLPRAIEEWNAASGTVVCDHEKIYIRDKASLSRWERAAILATHTGNVSVHSFAAEVEYHARFLIPIAKIPVPFLGRSVYASAIRADMSIADAEFEGAAPFYRLDSRIVKRQRKLHKEADREGKEEDG